MRRTWLFDLDNTLHDASRHIFPHINRSMTAYIERHLKLDNSAACALRQHYWQRYGATLLGLMRHHGTDPVHFLAETHQLPELHRLTVFDKPVIRALRRLPGRKILFSNAPAGYTARLLALTGLGRCFAAVYTVEKLRFQPKPQLSGYRLLLQREQLDPRRCIMVEDTLDNLASAKRLGMRTVWVSADSRQPPY